MSAIPGPWSAKVSRSPLRSPSASDSSCTVPPPAWSTVFRASSLAAVIILVWSTRLKPSSVDHLRTAWRTTTTSSEERMSRRSLFDTTIGVLRRAPAHRGPQELHAFFHVERGAHPRERQPQLDQRDGDGRLHADHDRLGVQH